MIDCVITIYVTFHGSVSQVLHATQGKPCERRSMHISCLVSRAVFKLKSKRPSGVIDDQI